MADIDLLLLTGAQEGCCYSHHSRRRCRLGGPVQVCTLLLGDAYRAVAGNLGCKAGFSDSKSALQGTMIAVSLLMCSMKYSFL